MGRIDALLLVGYILCLLNEGVLSFDVMISSAKHGVIVANYLSQRDFQPVSGIICGKYQLQQDRLLGTGVTGAVYEGYIISGNSSSTTSTMSKKSRKVVIKVVLSNYSFGVESLKREWTVYQDTQGSELNQAHCFGPHFHDGMNSVHVLVMDHVGRVLGSLRSHTKAMSQVNMRDIYTIGKGVLKNLKILHDHSFIHHDVHLLNIAYVTVEVGTGNNRIKQKQGCLFDFAFAEKFVFDATTVYNATEHKPIAPCNKQPECSVRSVSSPCFISRRTCSRRDDLYALGVSLVELYFQVFLRRQKRNLDRVLLDHYTPLPWTTPTNDVTKFALSRFDFSTVFLRRESSAHNARLPFRFQSYFRYLYTLNFNSVPDYEYLAHTLAGLK
jgi:serine/threonine protein kinase